MTRTERIPAWAFKLIMEQGRTIKFLEDRVELLEKDVAALKPIDEKVSDGLKGLDGPLVEKEPAPEPKGTWRPAPPEPGKRRLK